MFIVNILYIAAMFPPDISAPDIFFAMVGSKSNYTFSLVSDVGFLTFAFNGVIGSSALPSSIDITVSQVNSTTLSLSWIPIHHTESFQFDVITYRLVRSMPNAYSLFRPQVQLCNCKNGGTCTTDGVLQYDNSFVLLQCICLAGKKKLNIFKMQLASYLVVKVAQVLLVLVLS